MSDYNNRWQSLLSINFCWGVTGDPVQQHTGKSPLEEDGNSLDQMAHLLSLLLSSMASQSTAKLAELLQSNLVPAPERLRHNGDELNPLLPAPFLGVSALVWNQELQAPAQLHWASWDPPGSGSDEQQPPS